MANIPEATATRLRRSHPFTSEQFQRVMGITIESDRDFAMHLLEEFDVAVVPGCGFMASPYIRISYAASEDELKRACGRILAACTALSESEKTHEQSEAAA